MRELRTTRGEQLQHAEKRSQFDACGPNSVLRGEKTFVTPLKIAPDGGIGKPERPYDVSWSVLLCGGRNRVPNERKGSPGLSSVLRPKGKQNDAPLADTNLRQGDLSAQPALA
jgi:hypothetical protein